jgi:hypothetical protein
MGRVGRNGRMEVGSLRMDASVPSCPLSNVSSYLVIAARAIATLFCSLRSGAALAATARRSTLSGSFSSPGPREQSHGAERKNSSLR